MPSIGEISGQIRRAGKQREAAPAAKAEKKAPKIVKKREKSIAYNSQAVTEHQEAAKDRHRELLKIAIK